MAGEVKRVSFTTIAGGREGGVGSAVAAFGAPSSSTMSAKALTSGKLSSGGGGGAKKGAGSGGEEAKQKSFRIEVKLFESDKESFPEYNYRKLLFVQKVCRRTTFSIYLIDCELAQRERERDKNKVTIISYFVFLLRSIFRKRNARRRNSDQMDLPVVPTMIRWAWTTTMMMWRDWPGKWRRNT